MSPQKSAVSSSSETVIGRGDRDWIRGVNLGGWLVQERFITPYHFAVTDCHLAGDFCWYPGQLSAPDENSPDYELCDLLRCRPVRQPNVFGEIDFPMDEYTLGQAFAGQQETTGAAWLEHHLKTFVTREDIFELKRAGVTHVRVPLPHWILGDMEPDEPWIVGNRWHYFQKLIGWCREAQMTVWPDLHTAPGSQNGFDNSGHQNSYTTAKGWSTHPDRVEHELRILHKILNRIVEDGADDVVTGFGLLNEPFLDIDRPTLLKFNNAGLDLVREILGSQAYVYVHDAFRPKTWDKNWLGMYKGKHSWWTDPTKYNHTFLDTHSYQVFASNPRALSPREHIAYVCQYQTRQFTSCCYEGHPWWPWKAADASQGIRRMMGEWSAAYDTLPVAKLKQVMDGIAVSGIMPDLDRALSPPRQQFLRQYVEAQMVAWEAEDAGVSDAWFYWNVKMEGGAFAEWDFMRGIQEGWIPPIPAPDVSSQSLYGRCYDIIFQTNDRMDILDVFPDPSTLPATNWQGVEIDDDVVLSHGESLVRKSDGRYYPRHHYRVRWLIYVTCFAAGIVFWRFVTRHRRNKRHEYEMLYSGTDEDEEIESPYSSTSTDNN